MTTLKEEQVVVLNAWDATTDAIIIVNMDGSGEPSILEVEDTLD